MTRPATEVDQLMLYGVHKETDSYALTKLMCDYMDNPYIGSAVSSNNYTPLELLVILAHYSVFPMVKKAAKFRLETLLKLQTPNFMVYMGKQIEDTGIQSTVHSYVFLKNLLKQVGTSARMEATKGDTNETK